MTSELVLAAAVDVAAWSGMLVWLRTRGPRRPWRWGRSGKAAEPGPAGPVPATVLAALRAGRAKDPQVLNTAVFELVERGVLEIEPADSTHPALVRAVNLPRANTLPPYQVAVVSRVLHRQSGERRSVPLTALQPGEDGSARVWHRRFMDEVHREAEARGLLHRGADSVTYVRLGVFGLGLGAFAGNIVSHQVHNGALFLAACGATGLAYISSLRWAGRTRPTSTGRRLLGRLQESVTETEAAVEALLRPENPLPATAPEPKPGVKVLPNQLRPLPEHQVWSDYGGEWHPVSIGARSHYRYGGSNEYLLPGLFAMICVVSALNAVGTDNNISPWQALAFIGVPGCFLLAGAAVQLRRRKLPKRALLRGQVVKLWSVRRNDTNTAQFYYCTLDVGQGSDGVRLRVNGYVYARLRVGALVEVTVNPRTKRIKDIRPFGV